MKVKNLILAAFMKVVPTYLTKIILASPGEVPNPTLSCLETRKFTPETLSEFSKATQLARC